MTPNVAYLQPEEALKGKSLLSKLPVTFEFELEPGLEPRIADEIEFGKAREAEINETH